MTFEAGARRALPWVVAAALISSWWLSLLVLLDTPLIDMTPPKIVVLAGGVVLAAARPWRVPIRRWAAMWPIGAYLSWFPLAALLRGTQEDLKTAAAYLVFGGLAAAIAFAAMRFGRQRAARMLVIVVLGAVVVSFLAAALERATYPLPGQADPLAWFWSLFRPQAGLADPRLGYIPAPPLHAPTGEPGVVRATGFFVQTNYLAFFTVLAVPLLMALLVTSARAGRQLPTLLAAIGLGAALTTAYWTYARVGIVAVAMAAVAALLVEWFSVRERRTMRPSFGQLKPTLLGLGIAGVVVVGSLLSDGVGLSRLTGTTLGDAPPTETPQPGAPPESAAESAARSAATRIELQRTAFDMVTGDGRALLLGPGLAAFESAVHDPASPRHLPAAFGIRDPNSLWLTAALAGGVVADLLLVVLLGYLMWRLARAVRVGHGWPRLAVLWLAAWLPVWALVQVFGTNPFNTSEAIIFGTMVGAIIGLTEARGADASSGNAHQA